MLNQLSIPIIHTSALIFAGICLTASLALCHLTPEGSLFLFVTGCSWLGLACLARISANEETDHGGSVRTENCI
jgi:hypothetical protein